MYKASKVQNKINEPEVEEYIHFFLCGQITREQIFYHFNKISSIEEIKLIETLILEMFQGRLFLFVLN